MRLKTASQNAKLQYEANGRSPPGFHLPVWRFRTPASFWSQMGTCQIWHETVKTGGATAENVLFPVLVFLGVGFVSRLYLCWLLVHTAQSWQTGPLVNAIQLCEESRS